MELTNDMVLQRNVDQAIKWEPLLKASQIGVVVENGIATLTGIVNCYRKKIEAEGAAKSVIGVKSVVQNINVEFGADTQITDSDIASQATGALKQNKHLSDDHLILKVENGWISLSGEVNWNYQREAASEVLSNIPGVKGISNNTIIKQESKDAIEGLEIENALNRNTAINNQKIAVVVTGSKVVLSGTVLSWYQKEQAEKIAWKAPGVWTVENEIVVE
jgi:osmotically-inducible protein OsmY